MDTTERLHFHFSLSCFGEGNGNPLQCSCLENPRDGGAWWAAICGVAQSWTRLKQLSSSRSIISGFPVLHSFPVCSNLRPLYQWCCPTISSLAIHFSICPSSFPASGSFPKMWLFTLGGQSIGVLVSQCYLKSVFQAIILMLPQTKFYLQVSCLCFFKSK